MGFYKTSVGRHIAKNPVKGSGRLWRVDRLIKKRLSPDKKIRKYLQIDIVNIYSATRPAVVTQTKFLTSFVQVTNQIARLCLNEPPLHQCESNFNLFLIVKPLIQLLISTTKTFIQLEI